MKFNVSEVAKILKVDRDWVKTWAFKFTDYLNPLANPAKGSARQFIPSDLSVLAYVSSYWEDDPDIESIKNGLNAGDNNEYPFNEIITETVPFFIEPPEGLDDTWQHEILNIPIRYGRPTVIPIPTKIRSKSNVFSSLS